MTLTLRARRLCPACDLPLRRLFSTTSPARVFRPQEPYELQTPYIDADGHPIEITRVMEGDGTDQRRFAEFLQILAEPNARTWYERYGAFDGFGLKAKPRFRKVLSEDGGGMVITQVGSEDEVAGLRKRDFGVGLVGDGSVDSRLGISAPSPVGSKGVGEIGFYNVKAAERAGKRVKERLADDEDWWSEKEETLELGEGFEWVKDDDGSFRQERSLDLGRGLPDRKLSAQEYEAMIAERVSDGRKIVKGTAADGHDADRFGRGAAMRKIVMDRPASRPTVFRRPTGGGGGFGLSAKEFDEGEYRALGNIDRMRYESAPHHNGYDPRESRGGDSQQKSERSRGQDSQYGFERSRGQDSQYGFERSAPRAESTRGQRYGQGQEEGFTDRRAQAQNLEQPRASLVAPAEEPREVRRDFHGDARGETGVRREPEPRIRDDRVRDFTQAGSLRIEPDRNRNSWADRRSGPPRSGSSGRLEVPGNARVHLRPGALHVPSTAGPSVGARHYGTMRTRQTRVRTPPQPNYEAYSIEDPVEEPEVDVRQDVEGSNAHSRIKPPPRRTQRMAHRSVFDDAEPLPLTDEPEDGEKSSKAIDTPPSVQDPPTSRPEPDMARPTHVPITQRRFNSLSAFRPVQLPGTPANVRHSSIAPSLPTSTSQSFLQQARQNFRSALPQQSPSSPRSAEFADLDQSFNQASLLHQQHQFDPDKSSPPRAPPTSISWQPTKKLTYSAMAGLKALHASDPDKFSYPVLSKKFGISYEGVHRILKSNWRDKVAKGEVVTSSSRRNAVDWESTARPATRQGAMALLWKDSGGAPEGVGGGEDKTLRGTKWDTSPEMGEGYSPVPAISRAINRGARRSNLDE